MDMCILRCACWQPEGQKEGRGQCPGRRWGDLRWLDLGWVCRYGGSEAGSGLGKQGAKERLLEHLPEPPHALGC